MTEAYRYWSEEITMDDIASRKTDDKDALEELKRHAGSPGSRHRIESCGCLVCTGVRAWEKERATSVPLFHAHVALRAAVEKVRDELIQTINVRPGAVMACHLREAADALDAALRGGA